MESGLSIRCVAPQAEAPLDTAMALVALLRPAGVSFREDPVAGTIIHCSGDLEDSAGRFGSVEDLLASAVCHCGFELQGDWLCPGAADYSWSQYSQLSVGWSRDGFVPSRIHCEEEWLPGRLNVGLYMALGLWHWATRKEGGRQMIEDKFRWLRKLMKDIHFLLQADLTYLHSHFGDEPWAACVLSGRLASQLLGSGRTLDGFLEREEFGSNVLLVDEPWPELWIPDSVGIPDPTGYVPGGVGDTVKRSLALLNQGLLR